MKKLVAIILFVTLVIGFTGVASADEWEIMGSNDERTLFFDKQSFQKTSSETYVVWVKWEYIEAYGKKVANENGYSRPVFQELTMLEFDYYNKKTKMKSRIFYDKKGEVLYSSEDHDVKWENLIPNTIGNRIFDITYDYYKKHYK